MANVYGKTWWGKKWLDVFNEISDENRLPRGKTYANTGRAHSIKTEKNVITARVNGSRPSPYKVKIILNEFTDEQKATISQIINESPTILSALVSKQLPPQLFERLEEAGIHIFPHGWRNLQADCSCPDWAMPCKHIAAVLYLICAEIDKNPFFVFLLHGCDLLGMLGDLQPENVDKLLKVPSLTSVLNDGNATTSVFDQAVLDNIDLSGIRNLGENIKSMLRDDPVFYDKNFREILSDCYKFWAKHVYSRLTFLDFKLPLTRVPKGSNAKSKSIKKETEEEVFAKKWMHPEQIATLSLDFEDNYDIFDVKAGDYIPFQKRDASFPHLAKLLYDIPNSYLHKVCNELRFLHMVSQFVGKL
ncbi:MAG: SWIM zinc finger family protein, partial [Holosporales bacterium]|nr:SWIM zinc finger family protein [Holosporales bacterium]